MLWCSDDYSDTIVGFVNTVKTIDGGTHVEGLRSALTKTINNLAKKSNLLKDNDGKLIGDFLREGLTGIIAVKVPNPEFEGQTKTRLGNAKVRRIVDQIVSEVSLSSL